MYSHCSKHTVFLKILWCTDAGYTFSNLIQLAKSYSISGCCLKCYPRNLSGYPFSSKLSYISPQRCFVYVPNSTSSPSLQCRFHGSVSLWTANDIFPQFCVSKAWALSFNPVAEIDSVSVIGKITKPFGPHCFHP